jgi:hypothetical protein
MLWRRIELVSACLGATALVSVAVIWNYFGSTLPISPEAATNRVYPLNTHGSVTYMTWRQMFLLFGLRGLGVACLAVALTVEVLRHPFKKK